MPRISGKRAFLELLKQEGVEILFGNPGTTELPLMDAFAVDRDIRYVLALQEVDNLDVLQAFFANYVHRVSDLRYEHFKLVHGNDQRGIDGALVGGASLAVEDFVAICDAAARA